MINLTNPAILIPTLIVLIVCVIASKQLKNPYITLVTLILNIALLLVHYIQVQGATDEQQLYYSIAIDFGMILISFLSYLWVDYLKSKDSDVKKIDDGISWFWDKM